MEFPVSAPKLPAPVKLLKLASLTPLDGVLTFSLTRYRLPLLCGPWQSVHTVALMLVVSGYLGCFFPLWRLTFELSWQSRHRSAASGSRRSLPLSLLALCGS